MSSITEISTRVLEETPSRVVPFLRAIATRFEIRAAMMAAGYTDGEHATAWRLVLLASGYVSAAPPQSDDQRARAAIAEIDAWDEPGFRRVRAALGRLHPEQNEFVFRGISAARGANALVSVGMLLDRLDLLENDPSRAATREADRAALSTLEARGIGKAERARLRELLDTVLSVKQPVLPEAAPSAEEREAALRELRAWYIDWSETARAVIHRRDHLILMGLAHRRSSEPDVDGEEDDVGAPVSERRSTAIVAAS